MTTVCLVGTPECDLRYELLSRETARDALSTYSLDRPFENSLAVETISLGAAVSFVNDLSWYLVRFVETTLVHEPSISEGEWLSRDLARAIRDGDISPEESGQYLKVYGVERGAAATETEAAADSPESAESTVSTEGVGSTEDAASADSTAGNGATTESGPSSQQSAGRAGPADEPPRLVEPMFVARTGRQLPEYDLRDVDETLVVRVTESEFGG